jgi:hypothetical protein
MEDAVLVSAYDDGSVQVVARLWLSAGVIVAGGKNSDSAAVKSVLVLPLLFLTKSLDRWSPDRVSGLLITLTGLLVLGWPVGL